ncbi:uncharacterized protein LOC143773451 [Ranitomeya variabilis]|uniref:uncharacterized protein LOC143773451 n=1 Tax=Ranitomeya variabilis TaxID=490064 RepID=UPI0040565FC2
MGADAFRTLRFIVLAMNKEEPAGKTSREVEEVPMQIVSVQRREINESREHRLCESLCFYCGQSDHFLINCPKCPKQPNKVLAAVGEYDNCDDESDISECSLPLNAVFHSLSMTSPPKELKEKNSHCSLPIKILCSGQWISSAAMIDSGAGGNFMDITFAKEHGIEIQQRASPITMETVDGSPLISGPVDQETVPLEILLEPNHQEQLSFLLISSPHFPVILGIPWLRSQNSIINWETKEIIFPTMSNSALTEAVPESTSTEPHVQEHEEHVKTVLRHRKENHLYIKPEKCEFHRSEIFLRIYHLSPGAEHGIWSPINSLVLAVEERLTAMRQNLEVLKESLTTAQERYKRSCVQADMEGRGEEWVKVDKVDDEVLDPTLSEGHPSDVCSLEEE